MTTVAIVLKTNQGGQWVLPQIHAIRELGGSVWVVIPAGEGRLRAALEVLGVDVVDSPFSFSFRPRLRGLSGLWRLREMLATRRPDVVFYHLYASALAARLASLGVVERRIHMVAGPLFLDNRWIRGAERLLMHLDSVVIAGSAYTAGEYRALGQPDGRLREIPYGIDLVRFQRGADERERLFSVSRATFVVVMVSYVYAPKRAVHRGRGIKGHEVLLEAWRQFAATHSRSLLVLVGGGFDQAGEDHRQQLMAQFGTDSDPNVRWLDSVEDVRPLYSSADLSVSPSLSENHGAALEASAMGVPSIVSDAGGLPETVTPDSGWVTPSGDIDALARCLSQARREFDVGCLAHRGAAARANVVQHFDVAACSAAVARVVLGSEPI